jgi:TonB family protein
MRRMLVAAVGMMFAFSAVAVLAQGKAPAPGTDEWGQLAAANNLDMKGNTPFHLGMTFQLYDLKGKPTETGSFETWWTGVGPRRTVVQLAGLNENGSAQAGADDETMRYSYLVSQLIESAIHPVGTVGLRKELVSDSLSVGQVRLDCIGPKPSPSEAFNTQIAKVCVAPNTTNVLVSQGDGGAKTLLRLKSGKFHDTFVGLDLRIRYLGMDAIAGKITTMQTYDSTQLKAEVPDVTAADSNIVGVSGGVIPPRRIESVGPTYPVMAKAAHLSGSVLLHAVIAKDGSIRNLVPIAATDAVFIDSATAAVRRWRYSPALLNGQAEEMDTMITMNFALNGN